MKKTLLLSIAVLFLAGYCVAQQQLSFPFQGGKEVMTKFFKDNVVVSPEIIQKRAVGIVIFKFTADIKGKITKMVIYYADDAVFAEPVADAIKKSNHKWVIPDYEKSHDYIIPFSFSFNTPVADTVEMEKPFFDGYRSRKPITTNNQVPLDLATLLPPVIVKYDITR